jgi:2-polyprenyl-3-methyl-5-hydroxy-6-metoxy-1,4-benzoquinol methylase
VGTSVQTSLARDRAEREQARESHFWDAFASTIAVEPVQTGSIDAYTRARLRLLGDLSGKRVLDLGCGVGHSSALLALRGARVAAVDISARCVEITRERARASGVGHRVEAQVMSAYALAFPDASFDLVHGQDILHHLDVSQAGHAIKRVLQPGGRAVFQENNANNPLLMLARHLCGHFGIPKWSTDDEYPLRRQEIQVLGRIFDDAVEVYYPVFEFFRLVDMKFFGYRNRLVNVGCDHLDQLVYRYLPPLRPYGYKQIVVLRKVA